MELPHLKPYNAKIPIITEIVEVGYLWHYQLLPVLDNDIHEVVGVM